MECKFELKPGILTVVDEVDAHFFKGKTWGLNNQGYVFWRRYSGVVNGKQYYKAILLHREIMLAPQGMVVHHKNDDPLDNRRSNLIICTPRQNMQRKAISKASSNPYKGICYSTRIKRWQSSIRTADGGQFLGSYGSAEDAALVYNHYAKEYFGYFARLNLLPYTPDEQERRLKELLISRHLKVNNTTGFRGVSWHKSAKKYAAQICKNKKKTYLGLFESALDAARAYNEAATRYFGDKARLNPLDNLAYEATE